MTGFGWLLVAVCAALGTYLALIAGLVATGRQTDARGLAGFIPDCLVLMQRLLCDPRVHRRRKAVLVVLVAYLSLPIDLVPDFLPVAGQLDDAVLLALALRVLARGANAEMIREAWPGPEASLNVVLSAAGLGGNGAATPGRPTTL
jgi:uncharacterized membrane protein YkvA (DUF1232 family)